MKSVALRCWRVWLTLTFAMTASLALAEEPGVLSLQVKSRTISNFQLGSAESRFGPLEFVGGLDMSSTSARFGSMSAFHFLDAGQRFLGVTDTGSWFAGRILRDAEGRPASVADYRLAPILGEDGLPVDGKRDSDAEGMNISGQKVTVSFERNHRIAEYELDLEKFASRPKILPLPIPKEELRTNRGIETIAYSPPDGPLRGARVAVTEMSLNKAGNAFAAVLEGPRKGIFYVQRRDGFDISDGDFLPGGDLLLLERKYSFITGISVRLRLIPGDMIKPDATVDGRIIFNADLSYQIDNMEGLDVWQAADGSTRVSMISDDNFSVVQRNLYLEFRLAE
ncbi:esterase-like activity of phytase family protein [Phyllobacterium sp. CCNWLW109]|uniref:esterase-like activity of phytase family protein n=1 Tax=Phyllobacterium sp. CCNWLW109 TaxID=3127479 RepID=UPI003078585D